jgi:hypothetical protein
MVAELAFHDLGEGLVPLKFGDVIRAGHLAVPATDADVFIIADDAADRVLVEGAQRTGGDAGRIDAVHAEAPDEGVAVDFLILNRGRAVGVKLDDVVGLGGQINGIIPEAIWGRMVRRQVIVFFAGGHTGLTADTDRGIVKNTHSLREARNRLPGQSRRRGEIGRQ